MSTKAGELYFGIGVDASEVKGAVKGAFNDIAKTVIGLGAAYLGAKAAIGAVTGFLKESVTAAAEADKAMNDLASSMARAGVPAAGAAAEGFAAFASEMQLATGISDDAIIAAGALGTKFGITGVELYRTTQAAADMSAALGTDLNGSMMILSRAANGNTTALGRLGIEVSKTGTDAEKFAQALELINAKFGGTAASQIQTYAGRLSVVGEMWGDVQEEVGRAVTQNEIVNAVLQVSAQAFADLSKWIADNRDVTKDLVSGVWGGLVTAARTVVAAGAGMGMMFEGLKIVINGLALIALKPFELMLSGIQSAVAGAAELAGVVGFDSLASGAMNAANAIGGMKETLGLVGEVASESMSASRDSIYAIQDGWATADDAVVAFDQRVQAAAETLRTKLPEAARAGAAGVKEALEGAGGFDFEKTGAGSFFDSLGTELSNSVNQHADVNARIMAGIQQRYAFQDSLMMADAVKQGEQLLANEQRWQGYASSVGATMGNMFSQMALDSKNAGRILLSTVVDAASSAVMAYAASAAAAAAFSQAGIPILGPILAMTASGLIFGLVKGLLAKIPKAAEGGIVQGGVQGKDSVLANLMPGELIVPTDLTTRLLDFVRGVTPRRSSPIVGYASGGIVSRGRSTGSSDRPMSVTMNLSAPISNPTMMSDTDVRRWLLNVNQQMEGMVKDNLLLRGLVRA